MVHLGPLANVEALAEDGPDMDNADESVEIGKHEPLKVTRGQPEPWATLDSFAS